VQLRQAVDKAGQPGRGGVGFAVILLIKGRVAQAEIGRQVDDLAGQAGVNVDFTLAFPVGRAVKSTSQGSNISRELNLS